MKHKTLKTIALILAAVLIICCSAVGIYAADYYHMDETAAAAITNIDTSDNMAVFGPDDAEIGFIFYPGGKVEYTAYAPLMQSLAQQGILCVVPKMPLNLAVLDMNAAEDIPDRFPEIETWYIGGHSLGGSMAASCAAESDRFCGLILMASYSTVDLSDSGLYVLTIYGTEDRVLNMENLETYHSNLPADTEIFVIDGGNHAQFGSYGEQEGDGAASITTEKQMDIVTKAITDRIIQ